MRGKTVILALCLLLALAVPVCAETDMYYTGRIDPVTGSPYGSPSATGAQASGRVQITEKMYYDWDEHNFVYPLPSALGELHANVADGMFTTDPVRILVPVDSGVTIYRDGEEYTEGLDAITTRGEYMVLAGPEIGSAQLLSFTVLGKSTNGLDYFNAPDGFYIRDVRFDSDGEFKQSEDGTTEEGEAYPFERYSAALREEGAYSISYYCPATGVGYTLNTVIDRTPPRLSFDGRIDENGNAHSELKFTGLEEGDYISLTHEGVPVKNLEINTARTGGTIYDSGSYIMQVFDAAGNMTQYEFTIMTYFNTQSWVFVVLVLLVLTGTVAYVVIQRKRLKFG